jgi:protein involved in polysaccharide export with SLBB domain
MCTAPDDKDNWKPEGATDSNVPSRTFSLAKVRVGNDDANPTIYPGDVVYVNKAAPVYMTGEVFSPQGLYIKEGGLSLQRAIGMVGGFKNRPKTDAIVIHRPRPGSIEQYDNIVANFDLIKSGQQKDIILQPYDIVEVGQAKDSVAVSVLKYALGAGKNVVAGFSGALPYRVLY